MTEVIHTSITSWVLGWNCCSAVNVCSWPSGWDSGRPVRLDRITGSQREYIQWLLACCTRGRIKVESILTEDATDLLATNYARRCKFNAT